MTAGDTDGLTDSQLGDDQERLAADAATESRTEPTCRSNEPSSVRAQSRFTSLRVLWLNAAALLVLLLALLGIMSPSQIAIPDEGLYLAQAEALTEGSWSLPREAPVIDPTGDLSRLQPQTVIGDREIPYARHPLYPVLLVGPYALGGYWATLLISVAGAWLAALSAALIARRIKPSYGIPALWILGIGSPIFFYSFITMAHSIAAAAAGFAFLGVSQWVDEHRWRGLAFGVPALLATILLRSEGLIFAMALTGTVGLFALWQRDSNRPDWRVLGGAAAMMLGSVATYFIETRINLAITGSDGYGMDPTQVVGRSSADPLSGAWASLFRPFANTWANAGIAVPLAALGIILGSLSLRLAPRRTLLPVGFMLGAAAAGIGMIINPPWLVTGLFAAFPMLVAGLIWIHRSDLRRPLVGRILVTTAIAASGIIATIYSVGGSAEWGGRFFHVLLPSLTAVMVLGLDNARRFLPPRQGTLSAACIAAVMVGLSISALRAQATIRSVAGDTVEGTFDFARASLPGEQRLVVLANLNADGSSRMFWHATEDLDVVNAFKLGLLFPVLVRAQDAGYNKLVISTDVSPVLFATTLDGALNEIGWEVLDARLTPNETTAVVLVGDPE